MLRPGSPSSQPSSPARLRQLYIRKSMILIRKSPFGPISSHAEFFIFFILLNPDQMKKMKKMKKMKNHKGFSILSLSGDVRIMISLLKSSISLCK